MKILRVYPFLPPHGGGLELHVKNLTSEQRAMNHHVTVLFNQGCAENADDVRLAKKINCSKIRRQMLRDIVFYLAVFVWCIRAGSKYDVVHIHGDWSAFFFGIPLARLMGARTLVGSIHEKIRGGAWRKVYRYLLSRFDVVYCTGRREVSVLYELGIEHATWQPSGVSNHFTNGAFSASNGCKAVDVTCVAGLVPRKNLGLLLRVATSLPTVTFEVIGDGPMRAELEAEVERLGISNITLVGNLGGVALRNRVAAASVFYLPSVSEGTPTAMMEAMVLGLPVVVTPSNDYRELIKNGINGFVTRDFSVASSVTPLNKLLSSADLRESIARTNQRVAQNFYWHSVAARITKLMSRN